MREARKTYARRPVHSLCTLCLTPPKDQLSTELTKLLTWKPKGTYQTKSLLGCARSFKTYAQRTVDSLCNLCPTPPQDQLTKLLIWKPRWTHQAESALGYARSYEII